MVLTRFKALTPLIREMTSKITEHDVQKWLSFILRGRREEVLAHVGRVDITVTDENIEYVIEVKQAKSFLSAIGQVIGYSDRIERRDASIVGKQTVKVVALYDYIKLHRDRLEEIEKICSRNDIIVWFIDIQFLRFIYDLENNQPKYKDTKPSCYFLEQFREKRQKESNLLEFRQRMTKRRKTVVDDSIEFEEDLNDEGLCDAVSSCSITA